MVWFGWKTTLTINLSILSRTKLFLLNHKHLSNKKYYPSPFLKDFFNFWLVLPQHVSQGLFCEDFSYENRIWDHSSHYKSYNNEWLSLTWELRELESSLKKGIRSINYYFFDMTYRTNIYMFKLLMIQSSILWNPFLPRKYVKPLKIPQAHPLLRNASPWVPRF